MPKEHAQKIRNDAEGYKVCFLGSFIEKPKREIHMRLPLMRNHLLTTRHLTQNAFAAYAEPTPDNQYTTPPPHSTTCVCRLRGTNSQQPVHRRYVFMKNNEHVS